MTSLKGRVDYLERTVNKLWDHVYELEHKLANEKSLVTTNNRRKPVGYMHRIEEEIREDGIYCKICGAKLAKPQEVAGLSINEDGLEREEEAKP